MPFAFIEGEKAHYPVRRLCRALTVSPSGDYAWRTRTPSPRGRTAHAESRGRYGSPRLHHVLRQAGMRASRQRVIRLMAAEALRARSAALSSAPHSAHQLTIPPNRLPRGFAVPAPDRVWVADMTYLATAEGWTDLAVVLALFSRRVVGWAVDDTLEHALACRALHLALGQRPPRPGLTV